jgi:hypothetical protein
MTLILAHLPPPIAVGGFPEPGLIQWGTVQGLTEPAALRLSVVAQSERVEISMTIAFVNGQAFYLARIPFETRTMPNAPILPATPSTLELTRASGNFMRAVSLGGSPIAFANPAQSNFTFSTARRGSIERVDLVAPGGLNSDLDSDGDGLSDAAERLAGTNPNDAGSVLRFDASLKPAVIGGHFEGIVIQWSSVAGKQYRIERSVDLAKGFEPLQTSLMATGAATSYRDASAIGPGPYFYRLQLE